MLRLSTITAMVMLVCQTGCSPQSSPQTPADKTIKIRDLASKTTAGRQAQFLATATIDVYAFDLPAGNVGKLDDLWEALSTKSIWMTHYDSFRQNSFRVRSGRFDAWKQIQDLLAQAGAQKAGMATLTVNDTDSTDWPIVSSPAPGAVSYIDESLLQKKANLGPGRLVLRLRAEPVPGIRGVRKLTLYPAHSSLLSSGIPQLQEKLSESDFVFSPAAFAAQMGPGDLIVLAPGDYTGERLTLGGLFFNKAEPVTFLDPSGLQLPQQKPAVRVLILLCTGIRD